MTQVVTVSPQVSMLTSSSIFGGYCASGLQALEPLSFRARWPLVFETKISAYMTLDMNARIPETSEREVGRIAKHF